MFQGTADRFSRKRRRTVPSDGLTTKALELTAAWVLPFLSAGPQGFHGPTALFGPCWGMATIRDKMGHCLHESFTEATRASSLSA